MIIITKELPLVHPGLSIISWITGAILGVRWSTPASPTVFHGSGDQETEAVVLSREEMFKSAEVKVSTLSVASPWTFNKVSMDVVSSVWN